MLATPNLGLKAFYSQEKRKETARKDKVSLAAHRAKYLDDPGTVSRHVAQLSSTLLHPDAKVKKTVSGGFAPHLAVDRAFNARNPLRGIGDAVLRDVESMRARPETSGLTGAQLVNEVFKYHLSERLPASMQYKEREEAGKLFGGDLVGALPGYDAYLAERSVGGPEPGEKWKGFTSPTRIGQNLAVATTFNVAAEGLGRAAKYAAPKVGKGFVRGGLKAAAGAAGRGLFAIPPAGPHAALAKVAGLGLLTALEFGAFEALFGAYKETEYSQANEGTWKGIGADLAVGVASGVGAVKGISKLRGVLKKNALMKAEEAASRAALSSTKSPESLMEWNATLKGLKAARGVTEVEIAKHVQKHSAKVSYLSELEKYNKYDPGTPSESYGMFEAAYRQYHPEVPRGAAQKALPSPSAPGRKALPAGDTPNLLPGPVEEAVGGGMTAAQRASLRAFFDTNPGAKREVIHLGYSGANPKQLTSIAEYFAANPGKKELPPQVRTNIFGKLSKGPPTEKIFPELFKGSPPKEGPFGFAEREVQGKSTKRLLKELLADPVATEEIMETVKDGVPVALAAPKAALNKAARKVRATPKKAAVRDKLVEASQTKSMETRRLATIKQSPEEAAMERMSVQSDKVVEDVLKTKKVKISRAAQMELHNAQRSVMTLDGEVNTDFTSSRDLSEVFAGSGILSKLALAIVPVAALVGVVPEEAEAGMAQSLGNTTLAAIKAAASKPAASVSTMISDLSQTNLVGVKGEISGAVKTFQEGFTINPEGAIKTTKSGLPAFIQRFITPSALADRFYEPFKSPMVELASRMSAVFQNIDLHKQAVKEIIDPILGGQSNSVSVRKAMAGLVKKYEEPVAVAAYRKGMLENLKGEIKLAKQGKAKESLEVLEAQLVKEQASYREAEVALKNYATDWEASVKPLAAKYAGTRVALALEDTADFQYYPWLKELMSGEEMAAVSRLQDMSKATAARVVKAGGNVIKHRPFAHHAIHPDSSFASRKAIFEKITPNMRNAANLARLHQRSIGSKQMMPDVEFMFERYIPDVEKRLQIMQFWKKGDKTGWHSHMLKLRADGISPELDDFWRTLNNSFSMQEGTAASRWARRYYGFEVARLLFASPSVAFKHLMKQTGNLALFPLPVWGKGIKGASKFIYEHKLMQLRERWPSLEKTFPSLKEFTPTEQTRFLRATMNQGRYSSAIADLDMLDAPVTAFDKKLASFNNFGSVLVGTVEDFDRAATILMSMEMASKKGMTYSQAMYPVYDSIIRTNFLSGVHNPGWLRDPFIRAFFMFQGTPFKILEQRVVRGAKAGKDVKRAIGVTISELKELKRGVKEGEFRFKHNLIMDALTHEKDLFGTSVSKQFMVNMLTIGGILGVGDHFMDVNLHGQIVHPPFLKFGESAVSLGMNPVLGAGYKTMMQREDEDSDMLLVEFKDNWLGKAGFLPTNFKKVMRLSDNDIPEMYKGSKLQYLFAIPGAGEGH